jgi:hypothetical protein
VKRIGAFMLVIAAALAICYAPPGEGVAGRRARAMREATIQANADAAWEGLSSGEQAALNATGETGEWLDQLVVEYRTAVANTPTGYVTKLERDTDGLWRTYAVPVRPCEEDEPCWDCICGVELLPQTD